MDDRRFRFVFPSNQIVLILMGILILYLAVDFGRQVVISQQVNQDLHVVQAQIEDSQERQAILEQQLRDSLSDSAAEAWARNQGLVKEGEVPVVVVAPDAESAAPAEPGGATPAPSTAMNQWWELFFGGE